MAYVESYLGTGYSGGERQLIMWPRMGARATSQRGAIFLWGHGNNAGIVTNGGYYNGVGRAPAEFNGLPVVTADFGGNHWGRDDGITKVSALWAYFQSRGLASDKVDLIAISMGTLLALNWAKANPTAVRRILCVNPAVDLADFHDNNRGGYAAEIETAYGGAAAYATAKTAHNPAENTASFAGLPIDLYYSTDDTIVVPSTVTAFAAASGATAHSLGAVAHTAGSLSAAEVAAVLA